MSWKGTLHIKVLLDSLKIWNKELGVLLNRSFELYFEAINIYLDKAVRKLLREKWDLIQYAGDSAPRLTAVISWTKCCVSDKGESECIISGNVFNTVNSWLLRPGLRLCVLFGLKLQVLCQAWDINKFISFGASFPKAAKSAISFQEETRFTCFSQPV